MNCFKSWVEKANYWVSHITMPFVINLLGEKGDHANQQLTVTPQDSLWLILLNRVQANSVNLLYIPIQECGDQNFDNFEMVASMGVPPSGFSFITPLRMQKYINARSSSGIRYKLVQNPHELQIYPHKPVWRLPKMGGPHVIMGIKF